MSERGKQGYAQIPHRIMSRADVGSAAKLVWAAIANRIRFRNAAFPGVATVMEDTGLSRCTVLRAISELERLRLLLVDRPGRGKANRYRVVAGSDPDPVFDSDWVTTGGSNQSHFETGSRSSGAKNQSHFETGTCIKMRLEPVSFCDPKKKKKIKEYPPLPSQREGRGGGDALGGEDRRSPVGLLADLNGHAGDAAAFQAAVSGRMRMAGGVVESEYRVPDRGDGRGGRIDLRIEISGETWFVDLDGRTPRAKSVAKLRAAVAAHPGSRGLVVLRDPVAPWKRVNDVALIDDAAMNGTDRRTPAQRAVAEAFEEWRAKNGANKE